ncbi:choline BCCT transporter BetT [Zhihengliuella halotolerans]|uniref:Choline/glycine/proline betaine transport protein n=1 Tax=Zhihengliuella halotolerans TaxID=370736 RepID=A0A4Q8AF93_9MICC|nr:choline BCCT transporter BetT [Zhihengliuella halotolerans]RZU62918.1 choline/glycine/proline betaine transport protein [Zhihengliuella halotolerans]
MTTESTATDAPPGRAKIKVNKPVLIGSAAGVLAISLWAMIAPDNARDAIFAAVTWVGGTFGWYYSLLVVVVLGFVIFVAASKVGKTRLGPDHSRPHFNLFTWTAMLFAAGIGVDLMFFSVSEPITQYIQPPTGEGETVEAARQAMVWTLFHYGILGWGLYALMGLALAYFAYRHNLPLSIRSALYPIIGKRIHGAAGDAVDIAAMFGTIFGIATSLGIGVAQLNYGLSFMFGLPENTAMQVALIAVAVIMATASVVSGVDKGIRRLAELNVLLAIALMVYVFIAGKTTYLADGIVNNVGDLISRFPGMALDTFAYDRPDDWLNAWTLFFWAWWIAWAPFVGLFLARISRGRTIRQFVTGVLVVPFAFIALWISIFGNSALDVVRSGNGAFAEIAINQPEQAFYGLLEQYPGVIISAAIATFTGMLFYVTSADSGALVMSNFTSRLTDPEADGPPWLRIFWAVVTGLLTLAMLIVDGVGTLQAATVIMGLPFSIVLIFIMAGLYKALRVESALADSYRHGLPGVLSSRANAAGEQRRGWRQRLSRALSYPGSRTTQRFMTEVVCPALLEVRTELERQGVAAKLNIQRLDAFGIDTVDLFIDYDGERDFKYQVYPVQHEIPSYARATSASDRYYRLEAFSLEGSYGYDLYGLSQEQVIADVLDHYEIHLEFLHQTTGALPTSTVTEPHNVTTGWGGDYETAEEPAENPAGGDAEPAKEG